MDRNGHGGSGLARLANTADRSGAGTTTDGTMAILLSVLRANMKALRRRRSLTQEEAAFRAGIDYKQWQRIEGGKVNITLATLCRVSSVLGIRSDVLLRDGDGRGMGKEPPGPARYVRSIHRAVVSLRRMLWKK